MVDKSFLELGTSIWKLGLALRKGSWQILGERAGIRAPLGARGTRGRRGWFRRDRWAYLSHAGGRRPHTAQASRALSTPGAQTCAVPKVPASLGGLSPQGSDIIVGRSERSDG